MMNGPESRGDSGPFSVANKTRLALLPDLAVLPVLSTVVHLARIASLGFVSRSKHLLKPVLFAQLVMQCFDFSGFYCLMDYVSHTAASG